MRGFVSRLLTGVMVSAIFPYACSAADLPVKAPVYKAPSIAATYNWTGCYIGGHVGGLWAHKDWTDVTNPPPGPLGSDDMNSWLAGAQSGCDYQFASRFVIGIQGDYAWTDAKSSHITQAIGTTRTNSSRIKSLTTVTGRLGYAWDRFLGYVKGGFAWENDNYDRVNDNTGQLFSFASETRGGWTGGVGGEYAFTDYISGFVEYNYYDFGTRTVTFTFAQPQAIPLEFIDISERKSVVRAGINIRLGLIK